MNIQPYVYKLTHKESGEFYIGYREANKVPALEDLGKQYFTSSNTIQELGFSNFDIEIIEEFETGIEAYNYEQILIKENIHDSLCLNGHYHVNGSYRFVGPHSDKTLLKMRNTRSSSQYRTALSERTKELWQDEEYRKKNDLSYLRTDEVKKKMSDSKLEFYATEQGKQWSSDRSKKMWQDEEYRKKNDLSYLRTDEVKKKISESVSKSFKDVTCPYCGRIGKGPWMYQKHFKNCKLNQENEII